VAETTLAEVVAELAALKDPKAREVDEQHGDDHGANLSKLRALAKRLNLAAGTRAPALGGGRHRGEAAGDPGLPPEGVRAWRVGRQVAPARPPRRTTGP
jgi:hypothetical protein